MAAPTFVGAGAGVTIASGSGAVTAAGSGVAVGDLIVLQVLQDGVAASAVSYSAISGIANLAGTASSLSMLATDQPCGTTAKQHLRVGRATSTTCSVTVATTGDDLYYRIYVFRDVAADLSTPTTVSNFPTGTASQEIQGLGGTIERQAQSFLVAEAGVLTEVKATLTKLGTPTDNLILEIQTAAAGVPSGTVVGTVATQACSGLTTSPTFTLYTFPCNIALPSAGTYWIVARRSGARDTVNRPVWRAAITGGYAGGGYTQSNSGVWNAVSPTGDLLFGVVVEASLAYILENGTAGTFANGSGSGTSVADTGVVTLGADRLALQFVGLDDDVAIAAFTGMTGGTWAEAVAEFASATGTDGCIQLQRATMATAGTINGGATAIVTAGWGVVGFALKPAATGPATVERAVALNLVGLIATIGRELLARTAALNAVGLVASSGVKVVPAIERSAALTVTGLIATVGRELLPRTAALNAVGLVASRGIRIKSRSAALNAGGSITSVGRETISRSAALSATASIASAGREQLARLVEVAAAAQVSVSGQVEGGLVVVSRSASLTAGTGIATVGRELLPRRAAVIAAASVATVGRRRLHRSSAVAATGQVAVSGEILGAVARAAQITATGSVATRPQRALSRSATVSTAPTVAATGRLTLTRAAALGAVAAITTTTGKTGQAEFAATATITLSRYLEPGYLTSTRAGRIAVIYHGQIPVSGLGGIGFLGEGEGELAVGTVGGIARTGG